jgi:hypothetical protein
MRAIVQEAYGPPTVLKLKDIAKPVAGDDEVLVRVMLGLRPDLPAERDPRGHGLRSPGTRPREGRHRRRSAPNA